MSEELSFEDFFAAGTGAAPKKENFVISSEGFDGYSDVILANAEQALENLDYLMSFEAVSRMNAETKIRMLKKIKNNYNAKTIGRENLGYSIESVCDSQIQSLEDAVATPKDDKKTVETPKDDGKKKENFFKVIWKGIKTLFENIGKFFKNIGDKIATFFRNLKKADKDVDPATVAEATKGASSEEKSIIVAASKAQIVNASIDNIGQFKKFADDFNRIAKRVETVADKMANASVKVGGQDSMNLQKTVSEFLKKTAKVQLLYGKAFSKLSSAVANTTRLNKMLENLSKSKDLKDKTQDEQRSAAISKVGLKPGELYILDGKVNLGVSNELRTKSGNLSAAIEQFVNGKITKADDPKIVEIRKLSEEINKLVLGDKASYDISTIDESAYTVSKLFGVKVSFVKGAGTVTH